MSSTWSPWMPRKGERRAAQGERTPLVDHQWAGPCIAGAPWRRSTTGYRGAEDLGACSRRPCGNTAADQPAQRRTMTNGVPTHRRAMDIRTLQEEIRLKNYNLADSPILHKNSRDAVSNCCRTTCSPLPTLPPTQSPLSRYPIVPHLQHSRHKST